MASATYLAEHLAEVPAIVVPTIIGRHDGSGRPGLFDSVIQARVELLPRAARRGLGTTWMTAALQDEAAVKELLGIPDHMTEIAMFPVAWTIGTDFRRAAPTSGSLDHLLRPIRRDVRARAPRGIALRRRHRSRRRDRHRCIAPRRVAARHRRRGSHQILR